MTHCTPLLQHRKAVAAKLISSRSVSDGVRLPVSKTKLVYSSIFIEIIDNILTLICLLTLQQIVTVSVSNTHYTSYST